MLRESQERPKWLTAVIKKKNKAPFVLVTMEISLLNVRLGKST